MARRALPQLIAGALRLPAGDDPAPIAVGSAAWFAWLAEPANGAFSVPGPGGALTVRREQKGATAYWYAYRRSGPRLRKAYLGRTAELTQARIDQALAKLAGPAPAVTQAATAELHLLGAPRLLLGGAPVALSSAKAVALLGYLALAGRPQTREQLLALLWPESPAEAARKNLRNILWAVRATLGEGVLDTAGEQVALAPAVQLDLRAFLAAVTPPARPGPAALEEALALYRGPLLDGVELRDAPDWELWLTAERERLLQRYSAAVDALLGLRREAGDWAAMARTAELALAQDPLNEAAHRALMEALARRGDRAGALRQYELLRAALDRELGALPDGESEAIHDGVVRGALLPAPPPRAPALPSTPRPGPPPRWPFVGRAAELRALAAAWGRAAAGRAEVVVLSGELGIGKSRLWQTWAAGMPGTPLMAIQCLEATRGLPFAPLVALFSDAAWAARVADVVGASPPPWLQELSRRLPGLQELAPRPLLGGPPTEERQRLFEAFVQALLAVTAPPHLLVVDDLHWADSATLDWLDYALHRLRETPLLLVASYRTEEIGRDLLRRIAQWERERPVRRLALGRLTAGETADLLRALGAGAEQQQRLAHASAGNPYFLTELALAGGQAVPPALADLVQARVEELPEPARQLLQAAAALEPDIDGATLIQISALDEEAALEAFDHLLARGMLVEQHERYSFSHPLVATVVRGSMSRVRRATLHRRAATALAQLYAEQLPAQAGRIAAHYREAGDRRQAAHYATLAGDYAISVTAVVEAAALYRAALADEPSAQRMLRLGRALGWHGQQEEARGLLHDAREAFAAAGDQPSTALASLALADLALTQGGYAEAGQLAQAAYDLIGPRDPFIAASAQLLIGTAIRARGDLAVAQPHIDACLRMAEQHDLVEVQMYAQVGLSNIRAEQGDLAGARAAARAVVSLARRAGNSFYEVIGHNNAAYRSTLLGDYPAAHAHIAEGLALAEARALEVPRQWLYSTRGELALAEQAWDEAELWLARARAEASRLRNWGQVAIVDANLGRAAAGRGDLGRAAELLERAWQGRAAAETHFQRVQIGLWLADLYGRRGDLARARATLAAAAALIGDAGAPLQAEAERVRGAIERAGP